MHVYSFLEKKLNCDEVLVNLLSHDKTELKTAKDHASEAKDDVDEAKDNANEVTSDPVMRLSLTNTLIVKKLKYSEVEVLSVLKDKVLVGNIGSSRLQVYNVNGHHLSTMYVSAQVYDAAWTLDGNILCTICSGTKVFLLSPDGAVIKETLMTNSRSFCVSTDGTIYLTDWESGVLQSTDGGVTWNQVIKLPEGRQCLQVLKARTNQGEVFWSLNWDSASKSYSLNTCSGGDNSQRVWCELGLFTLHGSIIDLAGSTLAYVGDKFVFLSEFKRKVIHVLSLRGQYMCSLLSPDDIGSPWKLTVSSDQGHDLVYVGEEKDLIKIFHIN